MKVENRTWTPHLLLLLRSLLLHSLTWTFAVKGRTYSISSSVTKDVCCSQTTRAFIIHSLFRTCSQQQVSDWLMSIIHLTFMTTITNYGRPGIWNRTEGVFGDCPAAHRVVSGLGLVDHIVGLSWWVWTQTRRAWVLYQSTRTWMRCGRNLPSHAWTMSKALRPNEELLLLAVAFNPTTRRRGEVFLLPSKHTNNSSVSSHLGMMQP